ncbi:MAG: helix-turn-helix domain-containing protein [Reichenbachiella sp.]|uniref:helix-turn-helix transcriptional regulator n=1 Tax=Reichenbachiella sp. TaxID=2184521 RepID=UPI0029673E1B|nr:helix-turn-helix domain-containing protein [Reichenbachiella sp.]MDW3209294.1 helix-turn-helix domain-containing protein [Reichenbachiella sp.]
MGKVTYTELNEDELEQLVANAIRKSQTLGIITSSEDKPLNQRQAAEFLGISQTTIITWKKKGLIPFEQAEGSSKVRYYKSQLKAAIQKNRHLLQAARK